MITRQVNPVALYIDYRKTRSVKQPQVSEQDRQSATATIRVPSSIAAQVYQSYQQNRTQDREACIEGIMSRISLEPVNLPTRQFKPKGLIGRSLFRTALPALAAGLLALYFIPWPFTESENASPTVPASLIAQAQAISSYIDTNSSQTLGFSSGIETGKTAFTRGLLATDIAIAGQSGNSTVFNRVGKAFTPLASTEEQNAFDKLALSISELPSITTTETGPEALGNELASFQDLLQSNAHEFGNLLWFKHGQALQAVSLAAQLQLATDLQQPLRDSLAMFSNLETPYPVMPAKKLIDELKLLTGNTIPDAAGIRAIIQTCRDIKLLMR